MTSTSVNVTFRMDPKVKAQATLKLKRKLMSYMPL